MIVGTMTNNLTPEQFDRAFGSILGSAGGDALGSQYEFGDEHPDDWHPTFGTGVFGHAVGEWTDDTSMAMPILEWAAKRGELPLRHILKRWIEWSEYAKDVGAQTRSVLRRLDIHSELLEAEAFEASFDQHNRSGRSAGNGSLMRVGPYALSSLHKESLELDTLKQITEWTHYEDDNFVAVALWSDAIRDAILTGSFDMLKSLEATGNGGSTHWRIIIADALDPATHPRRYKDTNGWVVAAFQAALSAVNISSSLEEAIELAIRGGGDTDTVAAITGSLAGAVYGADAVPRKWLSVLHGWPGYSISELEAMVRQATANNV